MISEQSLESVFTFDKLSEETFNKFSSEGLFGNKEEKFIKKMYSVLGDEKAKKVEEWVKTFVSKIKNVNRKSDEQFLTDLETIIHENFKKYTNDYPATEGKMHTGLLSAISKKPVLLSEPYKYLFYGKHGFKKEYYVNDIDYNPKLKTIKDDFRYRIITHVSVWFNYNLYEKILYNNFQNREWLKKTISEKLKKLLNFDFLIIDVSDDGEGLFEYYVLFKLPDFLTDEDIDKLIK